MSCHCSNLLLADRTANTPVSTLGRLESCVGAATRELGNLVPPAGVRHVLARLGEVEKAVTGVVGLEPPFHGEGCPGHQRRDLGRRVGEAVAAIRRVVVALHVGGSWNCGWQDDIA